MKIHNVLSHATFVLESEDLFPGLDSSTLGSKKEEVDTDDLTSARAEVKRLVDLQHDFYRAYTRLWDHFEKNDALQTYGTDPDEIAYLDFEWFDKYEAVMDELSYYGINKNSPLLKDIEKHVRSLDSHRKRQRHYSDKAADLQTKVAALEKDWMDEWGYEQDGFEGA